MPVVDRVAAAMVTIEGLLRLGLGTGKRGEFATPPPKASAGALRDFGTPTAEPVGIR